MPISGLFFRRPDAPQTIEVVVDGAVFPVRLRRHRQARRYTLRVQTASRDVVLTMPLRGSIRDARSFAQKHGNWIALRMARLPASAPFGDGALVPVRGETHRIVHRAGTRGTVWREERNGEKLLCVAGGASHVARRVRDHLKREARCALEAASFAAAERLGVSVKRVSVRDQSSRWGSCSSTGRLSYSWRLIMAPPFVLEYLAAHEVAHLKEMNHSPRFWRLVHEIHPEAARAKAWLDAHGGDLHRYGLPDIAGSGSAAMVR
jgi:predicted metal-dependent hydrolase